MPAIISRYREFGGRDSEALKLGGIHADQTGHGFPRLNRDELLMENPCTLYQICGADSAGRA
jgi:hypothetical protein